MTANKPALALLLGLVLLQSGCATRTSRHAILETREVEVDLVSEVRGLRARTPRDYQHPAIISEARMLNILSSIEIETKEKKSEAILRQPAFHPELVRTAAAALVKGFAEAGPDEELGVKLIRKQAKLGLFHTKFLTSFLAHMREGHLFISFSRIEWPIPQAKEDDKLPEPIRGRRPMDFRVVAGEPLFYAGPQSLEIAWQDPVFQNPFRLPGSSGGEKRRREVLIQSPVPSAERVGKSGAGDSLDGLSPDQLRALADLEEDRRQGRITEAAYQRARRQLLGQR